MTSKKKKSIGQYEVIKFPKNRQIINRIEKGNHALSRKEVHPSIFDLRHIWIEVTNW